MALEVGSGRLSEKPLVLSFEDAFEGMQNGTQTDKHDELSTVARQIQQCSEGLLMAASLGQESILRKMIELGDAIGVLGPGAGKALQAASSAGHLDCVEYILSTSKAPADYISASMESAAWHGHIAIVQRLLECKETRGPPPKSGYEPYSMTDLEVRSCQRSKRGDKTGRGTRYFVNRDDTRPVETHEDATNGHILRGLLQGCRGNQPVIVEYAFHLAEGLGLQNLPQLAFQMAARCDSVQVVQFLSREDNVVEIAAVTKALSEAEAHGALSTLYFLLRRMGDNYQVQDYWKVFDTATQGDHRGLLLYLTHVVLQHRDDQVLEARFVDAAQRGFLAPLHSWLPRICTLQMKKRVLGQALDQSCANGHDAVAAYLIERGADVHEMVEESPRRMLQKPTWRFSRRYSDNSDDSDDWDAAETQHEVWPRTALLACLQEMAQFFDDHSSPSGGDFGAFRAQRRDLLAKQETVIDLLLRNGSDVGIAVKYGQSPLHYAVSHSNLSTCQKLLDRGASIVSESVTGNDESPLQRAARRETDSFPVIQALVEAGAEVTSTNTTEGDSSPILDAALDIFAHFAGLFVGSESVHEVLTTGPGAVIR
jgi:hypothetical protein